MRSGREIRTGIVIVLLAVILGVLGIGSGVFDLPPADSESNDPPKTTIRSTAGDERTVSRGLWTTPPEPSLMVSKPMISDVTLDIPGVTERRIVGAERLASAHVSVLSNTSYTVQKTTMWIHGDELVRTRVSQFVADEEGQFVLRRWYVQSGDVFASRNDTWIVEGWGNESTEVFMRQRPGAVTYRRGSSDLPGLDPAEGTLKSGRLIRTKNDLELLFEGMQAVITNRTRANGSFRIHVMAGGIVRSAAIESYLGSNTIAEFDHASLQAIITDDGLVRSWRVVITGTMRTGRFRFVTTTRYSKIGSSNVTPPEWLPTALNRTG